MAKVGYCSPSVAMDDLLFLQNGRHFGKCTDLRFRFQTNRQGGATILLLLLVMLNLVNNKEK